MVDDRTFGFEEEGPLAPRGSGQDREPFEHWWRRAASLLLHVPEEVAKEWVHRHWNNGPISPHIDLMKTRFSLEHWPAEELSRIQRSEAWARNDATHAMTHWERIPAFVPRFMLANGAWPSPIVVGRGLSAFPRLRAALFAGRDPTKPILLEGHVRFEIWRSMRNENRVLRDPLPVWVAEPA